MSAASSIRRAGVVGPSVRTHLADGSSLLGVHTGEASGLLATTTLPVVWTPGVRQHGEGLAWPVWAAAQGAGMQCDVSIDAVQSAPAGMVSRSA
jgi:hypothetical protein